MHGKGKKDTARCEAIQGRENVLQKSTGLSVESEKCLLCSSLKKRGIHKPANKSYLTIHSHQESDSTLIVSNYP